MASLLGSLVLHAATVLSFLVLWSEDGGRLPRPQLAEGETSVAIRWLAPRPRVPRAELPQPLLSRPPDPREIRVPPEEILTLARASYAEPTPTPPPLKEVPPPEAPSIEPRTSETETALEPVEVSAVGPAIVDPEPPVLERRGFKKCEPLGALKAVYPDRCRKLGHEGTATLECRVDSGGRVTSVVVVESAGCWELDRAAVACVSQAEFAPSEEEGLPVESLVRLPVRFDLVSDRAGSRAPAPSPGTGTLVSKAPPD